MKLVVLGDLHLDPRETTAFDRARTLIRAQAPDAVVCLGDVGSGRDSGTRGSFIAARDYLAALNTPPACILGNHDLERTETFATDQAVVDSFCDVFDQSRPYQTIDLGDALGVLLSSTGFRDNRGYKHEINIDDEQFEWLRDTLEANRERTTVVFSHAPPLGSRLRVLQYPHLRAGNAWLNQSDRPRRFIELLADHPQVRLWFSAHNHLGQRYPNSVSHVGQCLFVHTGVIGSTSRDGEHVSRVVEWDPNEAIRIDTLDHKEGSRHVDVRFDLRNNAVERETTSEFEEAGRFFAPPRFEKVSADPARLEVGRRLLVANRDMLVEYDAELRDPVGVVEDWLGKSHVSVEGTALKIVSWIGSRRVNENSDGYFFQVPARNPRLLNALREAVSRKLGRPVF